MLRCLLWIVYRAVVIELSEQDPSSTCALPRVSSFSMDICNISVEVTLRNSEVFGEAFRVRVVVMNGILIFVQSSD